MHRLGGENAISFLTAHFLGVFVCCWCDRASLDDAVCWHRCRSAVAAGSSCGRCCRWLLELAPSSNPCCWCWCLSPARLFLLCEHQWTSIYRWKWSANKISFRLPSDHVLCFYSAERGTTDKQRRFAELKFQIIYAKMEKKWNATFVENRCFLYCAGLYELCFHYSCYCKIFSKLQ